VLFLSQSSDDELQISRIYHATSLDATGQSGHMLAAIGSFRRIMPFHFSIKKKKQRSFRESLAGE
jgi:hypothetical protein